MELSVKNSKQTSGEKSSRTSEWLYAVTPLGRMTREKEKKENGVGRERNKGEKKNENQRKGSSLLRWIEGGEEVEGVEVGRGKKKGFE